MKRIKTVINAVVQNKKTKAQNLNIQPEEPTTSTDFNSKREKHVSFADRAKFRTFKVNEEELQPRKKSFSEKYRSYVENAIIDQAYNKEIDLSDDAKPVSREKYCEFSRTECNHDHVDQVVKLRLKGNEIKWK